MLVRHDASKERAMHSAPIDTSNAATPHPLTGSKEEPMGRTTSDTTSAATSAAAIPKIQRIRRWSGSSAP